MPFSVKHFDVEPLEVFIPLILIVPVVVISPPVNPAPVDTLVTPDDFTYPALATERAVTRLVSLVPSAVAEALSVIPLLIKFLLVSVITAYDAVALLKFIFVLYVVSVTRKLPATTVSFN